MPRVKIAYVVSFSSEDPEHRAANLLAAEVSKKKWLCNKWEPSCSVVLQLEKAVEISAVHIGAYHAALIEVLVGLSERPNDPFQVLVPSCMFVSAAQSRKEEALDRVRSFTRDELSADTRGRRYDRVRVVCSQPYNKHCKYGISFIHIHEPETRDVPEVSSSVCTTTAPVPAVPSRLFNLDMESSDEENFRPGELFAKHLKSPAVSNENSANTSTSAQIRQANSQAIKNISDASTKLLKTPINTSSTNRPKKTDNVNTDTDTYRQRDSLMYTDDDERPHEKIDRIVNRHKDEKCKKDDDLKSKKNKDKEKLNDSTSEHIKKHKDDSSRNNKTNNDLSSIGRSQTDRHRQRDQSSSSDRTPKQGEAQKRSRDGGSKVDKAGSEMRAGPVCREESEVLAGVTLVLSGYEGERRAALRGLALALGARYSALWGPHCTHLVCAFPNTPKLRAVRAQSAAAGVATARWLQQCRARRRRLPWQWFATLPADLVPEPEPERPGAKTSEKIPTTVQTFEEDEDTDDEIEKALSAKKKPRIESPKKSPTNIKKENVSGAETAGAANVSSDSDVTFVRDERFLGHVTIDSEDDDDRTDNEDNATPREERIDVSKALPEFFDGYTFTILPEVGEPCRSLLTRYVRAYGGLVIEPSDVQDSEVQYVVGRRGGGERLVPARWVWRCHRARRLVSPATSPSSPASPSSPTSPAALTT